MEASALARRALAPWHAEAGPRLTNARRSRASGAPNTCSTTAPSARHRLGDQERTIAKIREAGRIAAGAIEARSLQPSHPASPPRSSTASVTSSLIAHDAYVPGLHGLPQVICTSINGSCHGIRTIVPRRRRHHQHRHHCLQDGVHDDACAMFEELDRRRGIPTSSSSARRTP